MYRPILVGLVFLSLACGGGGGGGRGGRHGGNGPAGGGGGNAGNRPPIVTPKPAPTGDEGSIPRPAEPPPKPPPAAKDCQTPWDACKKTCDDAHWSCWTSCQYCGYCSDGLELSECDSICNGCRDGCDSVKDSCEDACESAYYQCRDG